MNDDEILINEEALARINEATRRLQQTIDEIRVDINNSDAKFVSESRGEFAEAFGASSSGFNERVLKNIEKLKSIDKHARIASELHTELDKNLSEQMK